MRKAHGRREPCLMTVCSAGRQEPVALLALCGYGSPFFSPPGIVRFWLVTPVPRFSIGCCKSLAQQQPASTLTSTLSISSFRTMRIRKRQPVVVLGTSPSSSHLARPLSAITQEGQGHFVAQTDCWSRDHQHQVINKELAKQDASPVRKVLDYSQFKRSQGAREEAQSVDFAQAEIMPPRQETIGSQSRTRVSDNTKKLEVKPGNTDTRLYGSVELEEDAVRMCYSPDTVKFTNEHTEVLSGDQQQSVENDLNHPSNKPKESLLYSLYSVFSRLSGKTVLTAREALSKIIEEGLPGLDEEIVLPSVQVAKVMRSNPYFVHLEGGKFLLCSGLSPPNKEELDNGLDLNANAAAMDPTISQQPSSLANGVRKQDRDEEPQEYTGLRNKRARSKSSSSSTEGRHKTENALRPEETRRVISSKSQITASSKLAQPDDGNVQICKRYDGRGWKCYERALEGYSMCRHHHELIVNRLARLRNSGRLGSKKPLKKRKNSGEQVNGVTGETEAEFNSGQDGVQWRKNGKARSLKSINT